MPEATTNDQNELRNAAAGNNGQAQNGYAIQKRRGSQYVDLLLQKLQKMEGLDRAPILGVTSPSKRQGVSTLATNLAIRAADHFKDPVLLVDCNYKNQRTSRLYRCNGDGFGECFTGAANIEQCVKKSKVPNLSVLGTGKAKLARQIVVDSEVIGNFFKAIRSNFRFSVLDLPTTGDPSAIDGMMQYMDGVFVVASYGSRKRELQQLQQSIVEMGGNVLGIIMTGDESKVPSWVPGFLR